MDLKTGLSHALVFEELAAPGNLAGSLELDEYRAAILAGEKPVRCMIAPRISQLANKEPSLCRYRTDVIFNR